MAVDDPLLTAEEKAIVRSCIFSFPEGGAQAVPRLGSVIICDELKPEESVVAEQSLLFFAAEIMSSNSTVRVLSND